MKSNERNKNLKIQKQNIFHLMDNSISKKFQRRYFHLFWNDLRSDINFQLLLPHLPGISETPPNVDTLQTFQYQKNCLHKFPKNLIKNWYFLVFLKLPHINALQMLQRSWMTVSPKNSTNYFHLVSKWLHKFPKNSITPNTSWHFRNSPKCPSNVIDSIITKKFHLRSPTRENLNPKFLRKIEPGKTRTWTSNSRVANGVRNPGNPSNIGYQKQKIGPEIPKLL